MGEILTLEHDPEKWNRFSDNTMLNKESFRSGLSCRIGLYFSGLWNNIQARRQRGRLFSTEVLKAGATYRP
jgi:hypothetical protein